MRGLFPAFIFLVAPILGSFWLGTQLELSGYKVLAPVAVVILMYLWIAWDDGSVDSINTPSGQE